MLGSLLLSTIVLGAMLPATVQAAGDSGSTEGDASFYESWYRPDPVDPENPDPDKPIKPVDPNKPDEKPVDPDGKPTDPVKGLTLAYASNFHFGVNLLGGNEKFPALYDLVFTSVDDDDYAETPSQVRHSFQVSDARLKANRTNWQLTGRRVGNFTNGKGAPIENANVILKDGVILDGGETAKNAEDPNSAILNNDNFKVMENIVISDKSTPVMQYTGGKEGATRGLWIARFGSDKQNPKLNSTKADAILLYG